MLRPELMYIARWDWTLGIAVWWFEGIVSDDEWEETFEHRRDLCAHSPTLPFRPAVLLYVERDRANALRRKQVATLSDHPHYNPYIACVSTNQQVRGAQVAMRWAGRHPRYEKELFDTVADGLLWLEEKRSSPLPALRSMTNNVRYLAAQMRENPESRES